MSTDDARVGLSEGEVTRLDAAARLTNLDVSDLQMMYVRAEVERILADRLAARDAERRESWVKVRGLSDLATPGLWRQEFYRDGEMLPDGTGGMDDYETPGSGVYVIDESSDEGYCLTEFDAGRRQDAAFIVAVVNLAREHLAALPADPQGGAPDDDPWGGQNPLGCCRNYVTEGGVPTHGGPGCVWPGPADTSCEVTR